MYLLIQNMRSLNKILSTLANTLNSLSFDVGNNSRGNEQKNNNL